MSSKYERQPRPELASKIVQAYIEVFISRTDCYPLQTWKGNYTCVRQALSPQLVNAHLRGLVTLGAYALDADSNAKWLCIDADDDPQWDVLKTVIQDLAAKGITGYLETSRRGGHLWLFTDPLSGRVVREFGAALTKQYDLSGVEIYPKQGELTTGPGSLMRLPFGIHRKSGKRYHFVTPEGEPLAPTIREQIKLLASPTRVPTVYIHHLTEIFANQQRLEPTPLLPALPNLTTPATVGETLSERFKNMVTVYDFVSRYVELDQRGKGKCPFHDDQIKSFQVHAERNFWYCYAGCGGGSLIDFWMKWREIHGQDGGFTETIKELRGMLI